MKKLDIYCYYSTDKIYNKSTKETVVKAEYLTFRINENKTSLKRGQTVIIKDMYWQIIKVSHFPESNYLTPHSVYIASFPRLIKIAQGRFDDL